MKVEFQNCPLCSEPHTKTILFDRGGKKYFQCENCKQFAFPISIEDKITNHTDNDWKKELSEKAASLPDDILLYIEIPSEITNDKKIAITANPFPLSTWPNLS